MCTVTTHPAAQPCDLSVLFTYQSNAQLLTLLLPFATARDIILKCAFDDWFRYLHRKHGALASTLFDGLLPARIENRRYVKNNNQVAITTKKLCRAVLSTHKSDIEILLLVDWKYGSSRRTSIRMNNEELGNVQM